MKLQKLLSLSLCALMLISMLAACNSNDTGHNNPEQLTNKNGNETENGNKSETSDTVTVEHALGTTEVPYSPQRVCVLDSACLDIMVSLDLTDYVTCVKQSKKYPSYLLDYYTSDTIIALESGKGHGHGRSESGGEAEENADPYEIYYTIDADLIIGYIDSVDEELYHILSQIAPTIVTDYNSKNENGVYAGALENARMIASVWGVEDRVDEIQAKYDPIYKELGEVLNGMSGVVMFSSVASKSSNVLMVTPNDSWEDDSERVECEQSVRLAFDLGMNLLSNDIPEEVAKASESEREEETSTRAASNETIAAWIEEANPDCLILVERDFASLEEAAEAGYPLTALENLTVVKNGNLCMLSIDGRDGATGLYGLLIQLDELSSFFLD